jgi:altronate hydrolase
MNNPAIVINDRDNVAVALQSIPRGSSVHISEDSGAAEIVSRDDIPAGHKIAITGIARGDSVIKYGYPIGIAASDISAGSHVHTHNLKSGLDRISEYTYTPAFNFPDAQGEAVFNKGMDNCFNGSIEQSFQKNADKHFHRNADRYFSGFRRRNGQVGIRNHIFIIPTVGCVNQVAAALARHAGEVRPAGIDRVIAFAHPYGCSQLGDDQANTLKILSALAKHPNAAGVLMLGLGCENCNLSVLEPYLKDCDKEGIRYLNCQDSTDEIEDGIKLITELMEHAAGMKREQINARELVIGLKCGGSDGLSGITANPLVGDFSDILIACGGSTILTEVPEMFGAEATLLDRCCDKDVFSKAVHMINGFKQYYINHDQPVYENPSPGNKLGGITTLEEKSLGCTQKSGTVPVYDVLDYGERVKVKGLSLLNAPGNDLVSSTALAAAGAHMVLFTTGRGTPFGCPVPTVKISSNSGLAEKKSNWIDFDAGRLLEGAGRRELAGELFDYVLEVASGMQVKSEAAGFFDMAIFKQGVTL